MNKNLRNSILLVTLFASISACSEKKQQTARDTLHIDIGGDVTSFDPQSMVDSYSFRVLSDLYEGLVDMDQANRPIPGMAQKWQISPDGKVYTFYLRDDLHFSDGSPLTANDFVYSWRRLADPKTGAYTFVIDHLQNSKDIFAGKLATEQLGVKALSPTILQVTLDSPDPAFLAKCTTIFMSAVPQKVIAAYGESWATPLHIVSTGAYRLTGRVVNGPIEMVKNDYFYGAKDVHIPKLEFIPYPDRNAALAAYKSGSIDMSANVPVDQYQMLLKNYPEELHTVKMEGIAFYSLNTTIKKLQNKDLRQALSMAVDREALVDKVLANGQAPLYSYTTDTMENGRYDNMNYSWSKLPRNQQIELAKQLYARAGYSESKPLELDLLYDTNDASRKVAVAISDMWKSTLGVKTTIHNAEWKVYLQNRRNGQFEVARNNWGAAFNFITTYTPEYQCNSSVNASKLCLPAYDQLIESADREQNFTLQTQLYKQALNLAMEQYAVIPLYQNSYTTLIKPYVQGLTIESNLLEDIRSKWASF